MNDIVTISFEWQGRKAKCVIKGGKNWMGGKFDFRGGSDLWDLWEEEARGDLFLPLTTIESSDLGHTTTTTTTLLALETSQKRK